jgi:hypothetical protein
MDPFTLALATFGVQKLRGKSTRSALQSAALVGGASYGLGALGGVSAFQGPGGSMAPLSSLGVGTGTTTTPNFLQRLIGQKGLTAEQVKAAGLTGKEAAAAMKGSGFMGLGGGEKLFLASAALPLLEGEEEEPKPLFTEEDYKKAREEQAQVLRGGFEPVNYSGGITSYAPASIYLHKGGIAEIKKFNEGGINYLPSKMTHDENDMHNYRRAAGYVEDGSGNGDKDTDTMLAQLADGEFVSRADAVLGAGILSGASPRDMKDMRSKGADFFYDQQKKFKRIFDLVNASKAD